MTCSIYITSYNDSFRYTKALINGIGAWIQKLLDLGAGYTGKFITVN